MVSLNDVLLAMSNIPVDDPIAEIWGRGLQGGYKIIEYTGALPITITADGNALLDYRIYGADGGVGVRTENLFDGQGTDNYGYYNGNNGSYVYNKTYKYWRIPVKEGDIIRMTVLGKGLGCLFFKGEYRGSFSYNNPYTVPADVDEITNNFASFVWNLAMVTKNCPIPTEYVPYGYKLPMTVQSANLFDYTQENPERGFEANSYLTPRGISGSYGGYQISEYIAICSETPYHLSDYFVNPSQLDYAALCFYDENYQYLSGTAYSDIDLSGFVSPPLAKFIRFTYYYTVETRTALFELHQIPVYIGENQLEEDEYVSYSDGKIYRTVDGTLTPTDPPVPLPEIPTIKGETVIDYDGTPKPSQMYVKYKGKGAQ